MLWPTPTDYAQAVGGFPHVSLLDSKLSGGRPKTDSAIGLLVYSGGFSSVFCIEVATNVYALRCWTRDIGDAKNRYEKISAYLKQVRLPYFVDFEYVPEGILINGKRYPITRMEWSEGELLRNFIGQNLQNATIFRTVADEFRKMVANLHTHRISHGDLQNGNILIKKGRTGVEIKLIDYDSLFVPALQGQPSPTPGLPEYQHPSRGSLSNEKVDYFSELVIYLSFLSLSERPDLWTQFGDATRVNDGLLFSKEDFANPDQSAVFQELANLSPDVQQLAATLKDFCTRTSLDELDPLEAVLPNPHKTIWKKITEVWQQVISGLKNNRRFIPASTLSLALVICFVAFLTQMDAKNVALLQSTELTKKLNQKESEIHQQQLEIQNLTSSIQTLENTNEEFNRVNDELRKELTRKKPVINTTSENMASLRRQLNEQKGRNRTLQDQLIRKNTEIRQLGNHNDVTLNKSQALQNQIANQNAIIQRLRKEKTETLTENQKLQDQNQNLIRQNQRLRDEKKSSQNQSNIAKQDGSDQESGGDRYIDLVLPELLKQIDEYRDEAPLATVKYTNRGIEAFNLKDYDNAVDFFKDAVKVDLTFAITHYNLGCVYLEMREYRKAINAFSEAVGIDHKFKEAYYNLSLAHLGKGDRQAAKNSVKLALRIDKNYQRAHNFLKTIEEVQQ